MQDIAIPIIGRFWMILISDIASIICSLFVFYYLFFSRQLRRSLHNHVVIVILLVNFLCLVTNIPWILYIFWNGVVWIFTPFFCQTWKFIDSFTYVTTARLVAWASIERHILVFQDRWMSTKKKRLFLHYLPLVAIVMYQCILYMVINYLPCNRPMYPMIPFCAFYSCLYDSAAYSLFEFISSGITNSIIIACFSLGLIIRVIRQKHHMHQQVDWRKQRKMTIQLVSITLLFYIFYLPLVISAILSNVGVTSIAMDIFQVYGQYFSYYINLLLPFVCAGTLPNLRMKLKKAVKFWAWHKRNTVEPLGNTLMPGRTDNHSQAYGIIHKSKLPVETIRE